MSVLALSPCCNYISALSLQIMMNASLVMVAVAKSATTQ